MNILATNKNIERIKKDFKQDQFLSTRFPYADKKIREIYFSMTNTIYNSSEEMINKVQLLKGKTKLKFHGNISNYYDEMKIGRESNTFQFEEYPFSKDVQAIGKKYHEVFLLTKILQTDPQVKKMNNNYYDFYYTVIKYRDEDKDVNDKKEGKENNYISFHDIVSNLNIERKNDNAMLR